MSSVWTLTLHKQCVIVRNWSAGTPHPVQRGIAHGGQWVFAWDDRYDLIGKAVVHWKEVEVRLGAGGNAAQSLIPPSVTDGVTREWINPLGKPPPLPEEAIQKLLALIKTKVTQSTAKNPVEYDYCRRSDLKFLEEFDWKRSGQQFIRPGKTEGTSASIETTSADGIPLFHCFTSNAPPLEIRSYNAFDLLRILKYNGDAKATRDALAKEGYGIEHIPWLTCEQLAGTDYTIKWLIDGVLAEKQPGMIGGAKKCLKTTLALEMALSLATGTPFLDQFTVDRPHKVGALSGESGLSTLKETLQRLCNAKGLDLRHVSNLLLSEWLF